MMESLKASDTSLSLFESVVNVSPMKSPNPPRDYVEFWSLDVKARASISDKFYAQTHIQEFLDAKYKAESHNYESFMWLWRLYKDNKWGDYSDPMQRRAIAVKLRQFKTIIQSTSNPFMTLRIDFSQFKFQETEENEVIAWDE